MQTHRLLFVGLFSAVITFGFFARAEAATTITNCGAVHGDVILGANLSSSGNCLEIAVDGATINGNGKTITVSGDGHAISIFNRADTTITNVRSNGGVQIYGSTADRTTVERSTFDSVAVYMGDDTVIRNNRLGTLAVQGLYDDPAQRATITNNTIESDNANRLVDIVAGGDGTVLCAAGNHRIEHNRLINRATAMNPDSPITLYFRCTKNSIIRDNYIVATGIAQGIRMRDEADGNTITDNTVWVHASERGALMISSGNVDKDFPSGNLFKNNTFRSDDARSIWIQALGHDNRFEHNLFWSKTSEGGRINVGQRTVFTNNTFVNAFTTPTAERAGTLIVLSSDAGDSITMTDNIFAQLGGNMYLFGFDSFDTGAYHGNGNHFWSSDGKYRFGQNGSLAAWRTATGDDQRSTSGNPRFRNPNRGDFTLLSNSPALRGGTVTPYRGLYSKDVKRFSDQWWRGSFNPAPFASTITPLRFNRTQKTLTIGGRHFNAGIRATLDGRAITVIRKSSSRLELRLPSLAAGRYDLMLTNTNGQFFRWPNAVTRQ